MHNSQRLAPIVPNTFQSFLRISFTAKTLNESPRIVFVAPRAESKDDDAFLIVVQTYLRLNCSTGVESGASAIRESCSIHRRRMRRRAVAPEEFRSIAAHGPHRLAAVDERNLLGEFRTVIVASKNSTCGGIEFRSHVHQRLGPNLAEYPFPIASDRHLPCSSRMIANLQACKLYGGIYRYVNAQLRGDPVFGIIKNCVSKTVSRKIRIGASRRQRRWRPESARLLIAKVVGFSTRVRHGVVVPRRQSKFVAVINPCISTAAFRDHCPDL